MGHQKAKCLVTVVLLFNYSEYVSEKLIFKILSIEKLVFGIVFCSFVPHKMIFIIFFRKVKAIF